MDQRQPEHSRTRGRADIHIHTTASDGLGSPAEVIRQVERSGLDLIAITDHDAVAGALAVRELAARRQAPFEVIVGCEVTAARGVHLLALFVEEALPMFRSLEETIDLVARQGGLCIAPHPLSPLCPSVGERQLERLLRAGAPLAAVETINPSPAGRITRSKLRRLNGGWHLAETGGSDAHFLSRIGTAYTDYDGHGAAAFRASLAAGTTVAGEAPPPHPPVPLSDYLRQSGRSMVLNPAQKVGRRLGLGR